MDENTKDVVALVGKRVLKEAKAEFTQFTDCSPLYIGLALTGILWASWSGLAIAILIYFSYLAYVSYKEIELDILFDVEAAKRDAEFAADSQTSTDAFGSDKPADPVVPGETVSTESTESTEPSQKL